MIGNENEPIVGVEGFEPTALGLKVRSSDLPELHPVGEEGRAFTANPIYKALPSHKRNCFVSQLGIFPTKT